MVMASGVWEGRGGGIQKTNVWDGSKSGVWDEVQKKKVSEPTRVDSSSANFSMDQVRVFSFTFCSLNLK